MTLLNPNAVFPDGIPVFLRGAQNHPRKSSAMLAAIRAAEALTESRAR